MNPSFQDVTFINIITTPWDVKYPQKEFARSIVDHSLSSTRASEFHNLDFVTNPERDARNPKIHDRLLTVNWMPCQVNCIKRLLNGMEQSQPKRQTESRNDRPPVKIMSTDTNSREYMHEISRQWDETPVKTNPLVETLKRWTVCANGSLRTVQPKPIL